MSQKIAALIKSRRRGAAIVEFSLAFMLFLVIMVTLMEFGRAMWTYTTICHAARQGARFAMTRGSLNPTTKTDVENVMAPLSIHCKKMLNELSHFRGPLQ